MNSTLEKVLSILVFIYLNLKVIILAFVPISMLSKKKVSGQIALITGGGSGFGRLLALRFADLGCKVVVCDINKKNNEETCRLITKAGGEAKGYICDVSKRMEIYEMAKKIKDEVGSVDILVNNAGITTSSFLLDTSDESIEKVMDVNLMAHFWTTKAFLPDMLEKNRGHIVYVASVAGIVAIPKAVSYSASKHGVMGLVDAIGCELILQGKEAIKLTVVCPYFSQTDLFECKYDGLMPMVPAKDVVEEIINGVLTDQEIVYIPRVFGLMSYLKATSTRKSFLCTTSVFTGRQLMDTLTVNKDINGKHV